MKRIIIEKDRIILEMDEQEFRPLAPMEVPSRSGCICGQPFWSTVLPICPVHGQRLYGKVWC